MDTSVKVYLELQTTKYDIDLKVKVNLYGQAFAWTVKMVTRDDGIIFDQCDTERDHEASQHCRLVLHGGFGPWIEAFGMMHGHIHLYLSPDGYMFVDLESARHKAVSLNSGDTGGLYQVVRTADGWGFVPHNHQPECWPPSGAVEWCIGVPKILPDKLLFNQDNRPLVQGIQSPGVRVGTKT